MDLVNTITQLFLTQRAVSQPILWIKTHASFVYQKMSPDDSLDNNRFDETKVLEWVCVIVKFININNL